MKAKVNLFWKDGWGGRIRTYASRDQNPLPYRLATPQFGPPGGIRTRISRLSVATPYKDAVLPLNYQGKIWWAPPDSNRQPDRYERPALTN
jgi:hypothetical protein